MWNPGNVSEEAWEDLKLHFKLILGPETTSTGSKNKNNEQNSDTQNSKPRGGGESDFQS